MADDATSTQDALNARREEKRSLIGQVLTDEQVNRLVSYPGTGCAPQAGSVGPGCPPAPDASPQVTKG